MGACHLASHDGADATGFANAPAAGEVREAMKRLEAADALLVLGDAPDSGWRFQVGADGSLDTGPLGLQVETHAGRLV